MKKTTVIVCAASLVLLALTTITKTAIVIETGIRTYRLIAGALLITAGGTGAAALAGTAKEYVQKYRARLAAKENEKQKYLEEMENRRADATLSVYRDLEPDKIKELLLSVQISKALEEKRQELASQIDRLEEIRQKLESLARINGTAISVEAFYGAEQSCCKNIRTIINTLLVINTDSQEDTDFAMSKMQGCIDKNETILANEKDNLLKMTEYINEPVATTPTAK